MRIPRLRFGMRTLLIVLATVGVALAIFQQAIMPVGIAEVNDVDLELDSNGLVRGTLSWQYRKGPSRGIQFRSEMRLLDNQQLLQLKKGDRFQFRYRSMDLLGWPQDDPHRKFMSQAFGISEKQVIAYVILAHGHTSVIVDGSK